MGYQSSLTKYYKDSEKKKLEDAQRKRNEFSIECNFLESYYGRRFVGKLKISKEEIAPYIELEQAPHARLLIVRKNQESLNEEEFKKMGLDVKLKPQSGLFFSVVPYIPFWLDFFIRGFVKRKMMSEYEQICINRKMLYFTFFGERKGAMVAGVDSREMSDEEFQFFGKN